MYNCYERESLAKHISFTLNNNGNVYQIPDPTTRILFPLPFLIKHFTKEILDFILQELNVMLEKMTIHDYPDGRLFTYQMTDIMNFIDYHREVWSNISTKRYNAIKRTIEVDVEDWLDDENTNFKERAIYEIRTYFDNLEHETTYLTNNSRSSRSSRNS